VVGLAPVAPPMMALPQLELVKASPICRGHWLYAWAERGPRRKGSLVVVVCSCGARLVYAPPEQYQGALDLARRNHSRHIPRAELTPMGEVLDAIEAIRTRIADDPS